MTPRGIGTAGYVGRHVSTEKAADDLSKFVETVQLARYCRAVIMQNFAGTLAVDGIGIVLAPMGILNPLLAATK